MARPRSQRDAERLALGEGALLTARRAAELCPWGGTDAERLADLRAAGLVRVVRGAEVVVWRDVLAWVAGRDLESQPATPAAPPPSTRLPRPYRL